MILDTSCKNKKIREEIDRIIETLKKSYNNRCNRKHQEFKSKLNSFTPDQRTNFCESSVHNLKIEHIKKACKLYSQYKHFEDVESVIAFTFTCSDKEIFYNCHCYALDLKEALEKIKSDSANHFVDSYLDEESSRSIPSTITLLLEKLDKSDSPYPDSIVAYFDKDERLTHTGKVIRCSANEIFIRSKFGYSYPILTHNINHVPREYGNVCYFYKKT